MRVIDAALSRALECFTFSRSLWIDPRPVKIVCQDGNVSLSGLLETRSDVDLLVELTRRLDGVVSVQSKLTWAVDNYEVEMVPPVPRRPRW